MQINELFRKFPTAYLLFEKLFDRHRFDKRSTKNSNRRKFGLLGVDSLEDRLVPTALGPDSWWDDGHWENGYKTGVTVSVHNYGSGWIEVGGGSGTASVVPGEPPIIEDGDGGYIEPPPSTHHYNFQVYGNVNWGGAADSLGINASGSIGSVDISGDVTLNAGKSVSDVNGHDMSVIAGESVGNLNATGNIGTVNAGKSVGTVVSIANIGTVYAGSVVGNVSAGGNVGAVSAGKTTSNVVAVGNIGAVNAGEDASGAVTAGGDIGGYSNPVASWQNWQYGITGLGVSAGRNIIGVVSAGGNISTVSAGGQILSNVDAGIDIFRVTSGGEFPFPNR